MLRFYCDESYDSQNKKPRTVVVGGVVTDEETWRAIEAGFSQENQRVGVTRYHGSHLNARDHEFAKWQGTDEGKSQQVEYSKNLLKILQDQGTRIHVVSVGILTQEYERIVPPGDRKKFGDPYVVCFKECITLIAEEIERHWAPEDQFSVIIDQDKGNPLQKDAVDLFYQLKQTSEWPAHRRLGTCTLGTGEEFVELQPADWVAYETFRFIHERHYGSQKVRAAFDNLFPHAGFSGHYYDAEALESIREALAEANVAPNGFMVRNIPEYVQKQENDKPNPHPTRLNGGEPEAEN